MSQIYTTRRRAVRDAGKAAAPARETRQETYHGGFSETDGGMGSQLGELMQARMRQHFLDHQNPAAEREADQLSAGLDSARTPEEVKSRLGERLGADFSGVRFHTGSGAVSSAEQMGARAYATGRDVYFGEGGFDPAVAAHELVHTVQQGLVSSSTPTVNAPAGEVQMVPKWLSKVGKTISDKAYHAAGHVADKVFGWADRRSGEVLPAQQEEKGRGGKVLDLVAGKLSALKRQNERAVDDLNHHREDYDAMPWYERALWSIKNPIARMTAARRGHETQARDDRAMVIEGKAANRALAAHDNLGDAAFDPLEMMERPGMFNSVARDIVESASAQPGDTANPEETAPSEKTNENTSMRELARSAEETGAQGTAATVQNDVLHGVPKTLASLAGTGIGMGADNLTNVARAPDTIARLQEKMAEHLNEAGQSNTDSEYKDMQKAVTEQEGVAALTGAERTFGTASGLLQMGASGMEAAGNFMKAHGQRKKGDDAGAAVHSLYGIGNAVDMGIGLAKVIGYGSGAADLIEPIGKEVIPGLGIVSGGMKAIGGGVQVGSALRAKKKMDERIKAMDEKIGPRTQDQERMYRTFKQARDMAKANAVEGGFKVGSGVLNVTGNAMTLGGVTAIGGTIVSGLGTAADLAGGVVTDYMKKGVRTDTVNEEIHLDERIREEMEKDPTITEREAKHIVLKSMGFSSGKRKEVFQHITMRRAAELYQRANSGDEEAESIMEDLGLSKTGGEYSLQGIAEKLGMDSSTTWQEQMKATKESRGHNPFKNKKKAA